MRIDQLLVERGVAASRAYYSKFYAAEAFLEGDELSFSSHKAVIGAFGKEFSRTNRVPAELHRYLLDAMELRHLADYGPHGAVDADTARHHTEHARTLSRDRSAVDWTDSTGV